ncbi:MAG: FumA C-terminus/TtdB family hydratase beta subunit [Oscillospiraceae bacterium]|nr:FumA C-terminus/TtdB family hydratase beta subunit [Oscillospiraceae bacterium]
MSRLVHTNKLQSVKDLRAGDSVLFSGTVYTARDAAHKRLCQLLSDGEQLPFDVRGAVIYYAGPTPTPPHLPIGSAGPTTSSRMDDYTPTLLEAGLGAMIGKGPRNDRVKRAIAKHAAIYFCALGGAGALAARCIKSCEEIAFFDLGCESVKKLELENFPLIVGVDSRGESVFDG